MTKEEWAHGSLLILNELLVYANPEFEKVRSSLDNMLGQVIYLFVSLEYRGDFKVAITYWFTMLAHIPRFGGQPDGGRVGSTVSESNSVAGGHFAQPGGGGKYGSFRPFLCPHILHSNIW